MCRVLKADMNLARVRDGSQSKRKAVTIRVSRVAESKSRHQLRGKTSFHLYTRI
jgi:hypothetical protein